MSSINQDITLTQSLADDPRNQLEKWLEDVEIHARNLCAQWDISGALTLVATDEVWAEYPGNVNNLADVIANGDPPDIRVRPTWAAPAAHADNAAAAIVAKYKEAVLKHQAFNQASSALAKALLVSIGDENQTHLRTTFVNVKIYALTQFNSQSLNRHLSHTYNLSSGFNSGFADAPPWYFRTMSSWIALVSMEAVSPSRTRSKWRSVAMRSNSRNW